MKRYRVEFDYTDKAVVHVPARSEDDAREGALAMIADQVRDPEITKINADDTPTTIN